MKKMTIPIPPNPDDAQYRNNTVAYQRAMFLWANETKSRIEQASNSNNTPLDQGLTLGSYTLTTSLAGTATGTDISNFLCTFIAAMSRKGIVSQNTPR